MNFLKILFILFLEGGEGKETETETVASHTFLTGDPAHKLGKCPDWE